MTVWFIPDSHAQFRTDPGKLEDVARRFKTTITWDSTLVLSDTSKTIRTDSSGTTKEFIGLRNGRPLLYTTHNRRAATTSRTHALWDGGGTGLDLMGTGQVVGVWDAGAARMTHVELAGRVVQVDTTSDGHNHSTHVAGTIAASGEWDIVRGMAPESHVDSYNWNSDIEEMAAAAAAGLTLSNHSYGSPLGWTPNLHGDGLWGWMGQPEVSPTEDFRFGWYDEMAALWDELAFAAPNYLIVKSAGNEREWQGPPDGSPHYVFRDGWEISTSVRARDDAKQGYDTIGDSGLSKNVLTVGASESAPWGIMSPEDVLMAPFSSWGPTDDGRIKPDLVAPGVELMSSKAAHDTSYGPSSGTSMSAPVVSGSAALLQELYAREFTGLTMLSSTLKGLLIHTADEAGRNPGPDYEFGWGHLNTERAAQHIRQTAVVSRSASPVPPHDTRMIEALVSAGEVLEIPVEHDEGALRVTLAWLDPAAQVGEPVLNDRELKLVHDLDLEVVGPNGTVYPWTLNPERPAEPAARGVNFRDNVEQVLFDAAPGVYTVRISAPAHMQTSEQWVSIILGEADLSDSAEGYTISGTVRQQDVGIGNVRVRIQGPRWQGFKTLADGVFLFSDLPQGTYTVIPEDPLLTFIPAALEVTLPLDSGRIDFEAVSPLTLDRIRLFESDALLSSAEQDLAVDRTSAAAGGVYGLAFIFSSTKTEETNGLILHLDTDYDPLVAPYSGDTGVYWLDESTEWTLNAFNSTRLSKRVPAIWFDDSGAIPRTAVVPYSVRTVSNQIIFADTLRIPVDRPDDQAPVVLPSIRLPGLAYAPPGESMEIRAGYLDGSPVEEIIALLLDRDDESVVLHSIPLRDSGNLAGDYDEQEGDGLYTARFRPENEAEYRLALRSRDIHGNEKTHLTDAYFSSTPFVSDGDVLLLTNYERGSRTRVHESVFERMDLEVDWWDYLTRGQLPQSTLNTYPVVIWSMHGAPIHHADQMEGMNEYLNQGGRLILLAQDPTTAASSAWIEQQLGVRFEPAAAYPTKINGTGEFCCFEAELVADAQPETVVPVADAHSIIQNAGGDSFGVQAGNVVVSSISMASLESDAAQRELMARLLYAATSNEVYLPTPQVPAFTQTAFESLAIRDQVHIQIQPGTWSTFEVEVAEDPAFSNIVRHISSVGMDAWIQLPHESTHYARARTVTPASSSAWSEPAVLSTRPANLSPTLITSLPDLELKIGRPAHDIDLGSHFQDMDGAIASWTVTVDDDSVLGFELTGAILTLAPLGPGSTAVTVTAQDNEGATLVVTFAVQTLENHAPVAGSAFFTDDSFWIGQVATYPLNSLFSDEDGDPLRVEAVSSDPTILTVVLGGDTLVLNPVSAGTSTITLTADDERGASASLSARFIVARNYPPEAIDVPPSETLPDLPVVLVLTDVFSDPEHHPMTFEVSSTVDGTAILSADSLTIRHNQPRDLLVTVIATDAPGASSLLEIVVHVKSSVALQHQGGNIPSDFAIRSVYPNPFRDLATFEIDLPGEGELSLEITDLAGRLVARILDQPGSAGRFHLRWRVQGLPSGQFFYRAIWNGQTVTGALIHVN